MAATVITMTLGAERIRDDAENVVGLAPWEGHDVTTRDGRILRVTATPGRRGDIQQAFDEAGLADRLLWPRGGRALEVGK